MISSARMSFRLGRFVDPYVPVAKRAKAPFAGQAGRLVAAEMRQSVDWEFRNSAWRSPSGAVLPWLASHDFGDRKAPASPLNGNAGRYARAFQGGPGGFLRITGRTVSLGSDLDGAARHRGGSGFRAQIKTTQQEISRRMRLAVGLSFGAWTRATTRFFEHHSRPHATDNPPLRKAIARISQRFIATGVA